MTANAAKKNMRNADSVRPVPAIFDNTASLRTVALTSNTQRLPVVTDRYQNAMITPFMDCGAWLYANSSPVADTSTSPKVSSAYGSTCQVIETASPPSMASWMAPAAIQAKPEKAMPKPIFRNGVTSTPQRRSAG